MFIEAMLNFPHETLVWKVFCTQLNHEVWKKNCKKRLQQVLTLREIKKNLFHCDEIGNQYSKNRKNLFTEF